MSDQIPCAFFRESWEDAEHPMACVDIDQKFVRVNAAFERLLGYSSEELSNRPWMEFTRKEHVGGDLASVNSIIEGVTESYRMEKDYKHKRGHFVPVVLTVRRYPRVATEPIILFRVESPFASATRPEVAEVEKHVMEAIDMLRRRVDEYEKGVRVHVGDTWDHGDKSGRDKITNSDSMMKIMVGGFAVMVLAVAWLFYYVATTQNRQPVQPPPTIGQEL